MEGDKILESRVEVLIALGRRTVAAVQDGAPLKAALTSLILDIERAAEVEMLASVLLLDGDTLVEGAAPSLPDAYNDAIHGLEIGPAVGCCGTAAFYGEPVFVDDIKTDPLWTDFKDVALEHGLRACWSAPIKGEDGAVLGTFANYYRTPRHPRAADYETVTLVAGYVAKAIVASRTP